MGQLRSALKGAAVVLAEPVPVLEALDGLAAGIDGRAGCVGLLRALRPRRRHAPLSPALGTRRRCSCRAGGGARFLDAPRRPAARVPAPPTGARSTVDAAVRATCSCSTPTASSSAGDTARRTARAAAATSASAAHVDLVDALSTRSSPPAPTTCRLRDDLAVLAVRDEPATARPLPRRSCRPSARELRPLRHGVARRGSSTAASTAPVVDEIVLAAHEAATNAVEHAYRDVFVTGGLVGVVATVDGDVVRIEVRDAGRWKAWPSETVRGRGLTIARASMDDVEVRTGPSGTTVSMRRVCERSRAG